MELHTPRPKHTTQKEKRIARGGKKGTTSGKGTKGQKSRTGFNIPRRFEGGQISLVQRVPKKRGFKHYGLKPLAIKLEIIEKKYSDGESVNLETLTAKGVITAYPAAGVKIIGNSRLTKKLEFENKFYSCIDVDISFRTVPRSYQGQYGSHYVHSGRTDLVFKPYALTDEEIEEIYKLKEQEDLELIEQMTTVSMKEIQEDVERFLKSEDELKLEKLKGKDKVVVESLKKFVFAGFLFLIKP